MTANEKPAVAKAEADARCTTERVAVERVNTQARDRAKACALVMVIQGKFQVIAESLSDEEVAGIRQGFDLMDTKKQGTINITELKAGLQKLGHQIPNSDNAYGCSKEKPAATKAEADARCTTERVAVERVNAQARERGAAEV
ncbi:calcium-dependent protein kinase 7-like protein [Tanacetum coccineum]